MKHNIIEEIIHQNIQKEAARIQDKESIKKIAVLFTDIAGSTDYIKIHGDQAGRLMLERHDSVASELIHEFTGNVIKRLANSVMAYFLYPEDALQAAIKLQQKYYAYNQVRNISDQVHIRISIHFGYGTIEENDIYGDVVDVTARLALLAESGQIYISHDLYDAVYHLQIVQFDLIDVSGRKNVPDGLIVYRVIWDETLRLEPIMTTILYIKPVWEFASEIFKMTWHTLFNIKNDAWRDKVEHWTVLSDHSVVLIMKDHASIIDLACSITTYLQNSFTKEKTPSVFPVYSAIDSGAYLRADKIALQDLHIPWEKMETGNIYISQGAYNILKKYCPSLPALVRNADRTESFLKLTINYGEEEEKLPLFLYHDAFIQGTHPACYYCGSKKHPVDRCPSKTLPEITGAINKVGYKSLEEINKIFFDYFTKSDVPYEELGDERNNDVLLAHQAFYDLKRIFQLRFFRTIWDTEVKAWDNVKNRIGKGNRSGITWIAQDCIRVSDIRRAESLLEDALKEDPHDYKGYCAWGFLNIEKSKFSKAEQVFDKALSCAKTDSEKIFLNFLLFRIFDVTDNFEKASEKIKEILSIEPYCSEAIYIDIVLQFRRGGRSEPLRRLLKLIQDEREYYLYALIDPDLKTFSAGINPHLIEIFNNVKDDAKRVLRETEEELKRLKRIFGQNDDAVKKADESWLIINKLADTESYFGLLDVIYHGLSIMKTIHRTIGEYKKELSESLLKYTHQIRNYMNFLSKYPNKIVASPLYEKLEILQGMARENWRRIGLSNTDELMIASKNKQSLFEELELIEQKMKRLMTIQWMRQFYSKFMKRNIIFITIILAAAFVVMPIIVFYVNLVLLKLSILPIYDIWFYQKMVMIIGSLCSIILSFLITFMDVSKKDFMVH